jgi:apolipoprotein N-acyltransferase
VTAFLPLDAQGVLVASLPGALPKTIYARFGLALPAILASIFIVAGILISRHIRLFIDKTEPQNVYLIIPVT